MKTKILILTLLVLLTSNVAFGQTRRRANSKARTTTTTSRPSASLLKMYTELFENYYFYYYDNGKNAILFKKPNAQGKGKCILGAPEFNSCTIGSYTIKANGNVWVNAQGLNLPMTFSKEPLGFVVGKFFMQADDDAEAYNEMLNLRITM